MNRIICWMIGHKYHQVSSASGFWTFICLKCGTIITNF